MSDTRHIAIEATVGGVTMRCEGDFGSKTGHEYKLADTIGRVLDHLANYDDTTAAAVDRLYAERAGQLLRTIGDNADDPVTEAASDISWAITAIVSAWYQEDDAAASIMRSSFVHAVLKAARTISKAEEGRS